MNAYNESRYLFFSRHHGTAKSVPFPAHQDQDTMDNIQDLLATNLYRIRRVVRLLFSTYYFIHQTNGINLYTLIFIIPNELSPHICHRNISRVNKMTNQCLSHSNLLLIGKSYNIFYLIVSFF